MNEQIIGILITAFLGWLIPSPLFGRLMHKLPPVVSLAVTQLLERLTPKAIDEMREFVTNPVSRSESISETIQGIGAKAGVTISDELADKLVAYFSKK